MTEYIQQAYAKINLSLDVTGKREDGYHLLRTVMQTVSFSDTVTVCPNKKGILRVCSDIPGIPENEKNIAGKAIVKLREVTGEPSLGAEVRIEKRIPSEAGLGGGSADAGAVLRILGKAFLISRDKLLQAAVLTGADVPFCLKGGTALCEGIGEEMTDLPGMPFCHIVIAKPFFGASTPAVFKEYDADPSCREDSDNVIRALSDSDYSALCRSIGNGLSRACAAVTGAEIPTEERLTGLLAEGTCLSGSGTAAYGLYRNKEKALAAVSALKQAGLFAVLTTPQG